VGGVRGGRDAESAQESVVSASALPSSAAPDGRLLATARAVARRCGELEAESDAARTATSVLASQLAQLSSGVGRMRQLVGVFEAKTEEVDVAVAELRADLIVLEEASDDDDEDERRAAELADIERRMEREHRSACTELRAQLQAAAEEEVKARVHIRFSAFVLFCVRLSVDIFLGKGEGGGRVPRSRA
jgi:chromosome segregation ATPase